MNHQELTNSYIRITYRDYPCLPKDLQIGLMPFPSRFDTGENALSFRVKERQAGRSLLRRMANEESGTSDFRLEGREGEKPVAYMKGKPLFVNLSHAERIIGGVLSKVREVGIDLEASDRNVSNELRSRILHPEEVKQLNDLDTVQIWTLKEAALKWCGSGLRIAMKRVHILNHEDSGVSARLDDGRRIALCSFRREQHWISVAWTPDFT
ncbi:MAG: 4'-phosphopantetheinyl transferase superfamily protein [Balneolaceae bacterium]